MRPNPAEKAENEEKQKAKEKRGKKEKSDKKRGPGNIHMGQAKGEF
jgi:hypothetical protein